MIWSCLRAIPSQVPKCRFGTEICSSMSRSVRKGRLRRLQYDDGRFFGLLDHGSSQWMSLHKPARQLQGWRPVLAGGWSDSGTSSTFHLLRTRLPRKSLRVRPVSGLPLQIPQGYRRSGPRRASKTLLDVRWLQFYRGSSCAGLPCKLLPFVLAARDPRGCRGQLVQIVSSHGRARGADVPGFLRSIHGRSLVASCIYKTGMANYTAERLCTLLVLRLRLKSACTA